jgi:hypothetical protein
MTRGIFIGLACALLSLAPAMAQSSCLTLSEDLRCFNEANNSPASNARAASGAVPFLPRPPDGADSTDCVRPGSVFLHGGDSVTCGQTSASR